MHSDRKAMRKTAANKASRLAHGDPKQKVDSSTWTPPEAMEPQAQTGMRPVSKRAFKRGGKVVSAEGNKAVHHVGHKPRKSSGRAPTTPDSFINRNVKEANEDRDGIKHVGGMKKGGVARKANGGMRFAGKVPLPPIMPESMKEERESNAREEALIQSIAARKAAEAAAKRREDNAAAFDANQVKARQDVYGVTGQKRGGRTHKASDGSFGEAFKAGRAAMLEGGPKTFEYKGKMYSTDLAKPTPAGGSRNVGMGGANAARAAEQVRKAQEDYPSDMVGQMAGNRIMNGGTKIVPGGEFVKKRGGKVKFEGSAKDQAQDKKLAAKRGMTMKQWEASKADDKHDKQESMAGLKKGGRAKADDGVMHHDDCECKMCWGGAAMPKGDRIAKRDGGRTSDKGKTRINIMINAQPKSDAMPPAGMTLPPRMAPPMPPAGMMPPPGMMPPRPPMGGPALGGMPMMRKRGGRTSYPITTGSGGGNARLEKIDEYGLKPSA